MRETCGEQVVADLRHYASGVYKSTACESTPVISAPRLRTRCELPTHTLSAYVHAAIRLRTRCCPPMRTVRHPPTHALVHVYSRSAIRLRTPRYPLSAYAHPTVRLRALY
eukprot:3002022-Rhodomonas_salina.1